MSTGARRAPWARYLPIAEHGLIGDLHTVALVGTNGTIDWYCCPRFDSTSVFGAILDADHGGLFRIFPAATAGARRASDVVKGTELFSFVRPDTICWQQNAHLQDFSPKRLGHGIGPRAALEHLIGQQKCLFAGT